MGLRPSFVKIVIPYFSPCTGAEPEGWGERRSGRAGTNLHLLSQHWAVRWRKEENWPGRNSLWPPSKALRAPWSEIAGLVSEQGLLLSFVFNQLICLFTTRFSKAADAVPNCRHFP